MTGISSSGLCAGRGSTGFPRRSCVRSCTSATAPSCTRRGSLRTPKATYWIGSPAKVSGTTFAPDRTAIVTLPPARAISLAISAPEFPTPTTSTRRPAYPSGRRYAALCAIRPAKRSCPGKCGVLGLATIPVATTTTRAASTRTSTRSVTGDRQIPPDPLGHAVREAHDRQVGVDLERVGKEARVRHPEPGETVYASPAVGHGVGRGPSHSAATHEMRGGESQHAGPEVAGGHALFETIGVGGLEQRRVGGRMHAPRPGGEEDAGRCPSPPHQAVDGLGRKAVMHDRAPRPAHREAIARGDVVAPQAQDHLDPRA